MNIGNGVIAIYYQNFKVRRWVDEGFSLWVGWKKRQISTWI